MTASSKFYPPQPNPALISLCQGLSTPIARRFYRFQLEVDPADIARIETLGKDRIVYLPNHPTHDDGIVLFRFSALLGQMFHYIVAYESFRGWMGGFLQRVGAYSIRRGVGDRPSLAQTLQLLQEPEVRLVIFPEGGCSYQNDTVMPFRSGAVDLSFRALSKLAKQLEAPPNLYLVPLSLKYHYVRPMNRVIEQTLTRLEKATGIEQKSPSIYFRLRMVGRQIILQMEEEFGLKENADSFDWNQRIRRIKDKMVVTCEQALDLPPTPQVPLRERIYRVQSTLDARLEKATEQSREGNSNANGVDPALKAQYEKLYETTLRTLNLDAIYDGYIEENPTQERFLDTLITAEREVFRIDQPRAKGLRAAQVRVGEMINLKDHFEAYQENRDATVDALTLQLQQTVKANLQRE